MKLLLDAKANPTICDRFGRRASGKRHFILIEYVSLHIMEVLEVCSLNSSIRLLLLKAEEKHHRAEQSDDSLEEDFQQQTVDSLSDDDDEFFKAISLKENE